MRDIGPPARGQGKAVSLVLAAALMLTGASHAAGPAGEPIGTVQELYDGTLSSDIQVSTYRNIDKLYPVRVVKHGAAVYPLPRLEKQIKNFEFVSGGNKYDLIDYMAINRVTGLLIIKNGKIAYEDYEMGNTAQTRWMSMSVVKSITATLIGAAIHDGYIQSIDDPVTKYLPKLAGSAYEGVSVRHLLQMASGVKWNETYTNPASDRRRMLEVQNAQRPGAVLELLAQLPRAGAPGSVWNYNTGDTQLVSELLRAATGKPVAQYLSERIWAKFGMESDATWWLDSPDGHEVGGSGLSAVLRDYGRFGLFMLNGGVAAGEKILPEGWIAQATQARTIGGKPVQYGYMWWPIEAAPGSIHDGAYYARGIFGQGVYINPRENVVIAAWGALPKPSGKAMISAVDFYGAATQAVRSHRPAISASGALPH